MKILFLLVLVSLASCGLSPNEQAISDDICHCMTGLIQVNTQIKEGMNTESQATIMNLFVKAGEEQTKALDCILSLSSTYGAMDKKLYDKITIKLNENCPEATSLFEKSGWYK